jgi:hypothetical protein
MYVWVAVTHDRWPGIKYRMRGITDQLASLQPIAAFQADLRAHRLYLRVSAVEPSELLSDMEMHPSAGTNLIRIWPPNSLLLHDVTLDARAHARGPAVYVPG